MSSTSTAGQAVGSLEGAVGGATFDETRSLMNDLPAQMFGELMFVSNHGPSDSGHFRVEETETIQKFKDVIMF